jgi:hypothetical protein
MNIWRIVSRMPGVVLESSSTNARFPRHDQSVDRGFGLRAYLFSGKIFIPGDVVRMETSASSFDLRPIAGASSTRQGAIEALSLGRRPGLPGGLWLRYCLPYD